MGKVARRVKLETAGQHSGIPFSWPPSRRTDAERHGGPMTWSKENGLKKGKIVKSDCCPRANSGGWEY